MNGSRIAARARAAATAARDGVRLLADAARPYEPMRGGARFLEEEYRAGTWDYLAGDEEIARFGVVTAYCRRYGAGGAVLELGCGEGLLPDRLGVGGYTRFVGIDISPTAVARAQERDLPNATFAVAEAETFTPEGTFDVIVFHEMLEYLADPAAVVRRYEQWLAAGGSIVVSQFRSTDNARTRRIWRALHRRYPVQARARVAVARSMQWTIEVLAPPETRA